MSFVDWFVHLCYLFIVCFPVLFVVFGSSLIRVVLLPYTVVDPRRGPWVVLVLRAVAGVCCWWWLPWRPWWWCGPLYDKTTTIDYDTYTHTRARARLLLLFSSFCLRLSSPPLDGDHWSECKGLQSQRNNRSPVGSKTCWKMWKKKDCREWATGNTYFARLWIYLQWRKDKIFFIAKKKQQEPDENLCQWLKFGCVQTRFIEYQWRALQSYTACRRKDILTALVLYYIEYLCLHIVILVDWLFWNI